MRPISARIDGGRSGWPGPTWREGANRSVRINRGTMRRRSRPIKSLFVVGCADPQQPQFVSAAFSATKMREEDTHRRTQRKLKTAGRSISPLEPGGRLSPAQADRAADDP